MSTAAASRPGLRADAGRAPRRARQLLIAAAAVVALVLPLLFGSGSVLLEQAILSALYVIMALGLNVVVGFAGLLDLGYVAFFAIGAHVAAHFGSGFWASAGGGDGFALFANDRLARMPGIHSDFLVILLLAVLATTIAGVLIGLPTLRVRGAYVGIVTLAFGEIIGQLVSNGRNVHIFGGSLTGGDAGMSAIDGIDLPLVDRFTPLDLRPWYLFALALAALMLFVTFRLRDSRLGRAWLAVREDEEVAASVGIPIVRIKLLAYAIGGALGGVAGAFFASYMGSVNPSQFSFAFSVLILAMVVLGGVGSIRGVVLGAIVLSMVNNYLVPQVFNGVPHDLGLDFDLSQISPAIYGLVLVLVMLCRPQGLIPERSPGRATDRILHASVNE